MISPLPPADDFARQLALDDLLMLADEIAAAKELILCSVMVDEPARLRASLGESRVNALLRELTVLVRRTLRGVDAVAMNGDELVILVEAPSVLASDVANRVLAAVRGHGFSGGALDRAVSVTAAMGVALAPSAGGGAAALLAAARAAREEAGADAHLVAHTRRGDALDLSRFVGRTEQLARLTDYLDDVSRGVGRMVAIIGPHGVGSSALARALQPEVRLRGGSLVIASCHDQLLPVPYSLWREVLAGVRRLPVKTTRAWRELTSLDSSLEGATLEPGGGSKTRLLDELADFLRLAAQQRPLVLLLESMQWADSASWDALEYVTAQLERERILVMLTCNTGASNDDGVERWTRIAEGSRHQEMRLTGLTRDDAKRWLEGATRSEAGRDLLAYLYRHAEGNPLHLTHLLRDLHEAGNVTLHRSGAITRAASELPRDCSLTDVLTRRLERLPPDARLLVEHVAVLGRAGDEALLMTLTGLRDARWRDAVQQLLDRGLLEVTYDREHTSYVLTHDEIVRVVRAGLSAERARALHGALARTLSERPEEAGAEIAGHFQEAGELAQAHLYALAGASDATRLHEAAAISHLLGVAERTAPTEEAMAEVRLRMASFAQIAGRSEEAEALCDLALAYYERQGDRIRALRARRTRSTVRTERGQGAHQTLEELLALESEAAQIDADSERAALLLSIGLMHWRLGDQREARRVAEEALAIAERGDDLALFADTSNRLAVTIQLEDAARARALFDKSLSVGTTLGDAFRRVRGLNNLGVLELISNNLEEARRVLTLAAEEARTAGLVEAWGRAQLNLGVVVGRIGDNEGAMRALSEALHLLAMIQNSELQLYVTYNMAHLEREQDHFREAKDAYELVTELAARIGQVEVQAGALAGMGLCRFMTGDVDGARRSLEELTPLLERLVSWFQGRELVVALQLHLMFASGAQEAVPALFSEALAAARPSDISGAAWLTAEFGALLNESNPELVAATMRDFASHPEVLRNPRIRERFTVLEFYSKVTIDRTD